MIFNSGEKNHGDYQFDMALDCSNTAIYRPITTYRNYTPVPAELQIRSVSTEYGLGSPFPGF
jgi:hypothetical protein